MSVTLMLGLTSTMVATAFLSGIFGMAGGLILMGVLLTLLPLPEAMALHAVTQVAPADFSKTPEAFERLPSG